MQAASYGLIHQSFKPDIPLYGTICRTGKEWTVQLQDKTTPTGSTISGNITGYGAFPRDKYPDIPVVDFTGESFDRCFDGLKKIMELVDRELQPRDRSSSIFWIQWMIYAVA